MCNLSFGNTRTAMDWHQLVASESVGHNWSLYRAQASGASLVFALFPLWQFQSVRPKAKVMASDQNICRQF